MDDERVVAQVVSGSREAFDELVRRHRGPIYTLIRTLAGGESDAEDLTQECFVRAYVAIVRFRREASFRTWLTRIAVNVVRTHLKRQRRARQPVSLDVVEDGEPSTDAALVVSSDLEASLTRRQAIERALALLPEDYRIALTLRDVYGFEYHEIAGVLHVPIGTIESRVFRARRRLRPLLRQWLKRYSPSHADLHGCVRVDRAQRRR